MVFALIFRFELTTNQANFTENQNIIVFFFYCASQSLMQRRTYYVNIMHFRGTRNRSMYND